MRGTRSENAMEWLLWAVGAVVVLALLYIVGMALLALRERLRRQ
jgi:Ni/Fe-hydrogenase subunit HybB-like protein